jgi:Mms19-like transcription regulator of RNA polymerase II
MLVPNLHAPHSASLSSVLHQGHCHHHHWRRAETSGEDLFDVCQCYFPITYVGKPGDPVNGEMLTSALNVRYIQCTHTRPLALPRLATSAVSCTPPPPTHTHCGVMRMSNTTFFNTVPITPVATCSYSQLRLQLLTLSLLCLTA